MYLKRPEELDALGIKTLPRSLHEAIEAFAADPLSKAVMGESMFNAYVQFKRAESEEYHNHVSDWERDRYATFY